jgi:hypothetical protein
MLGKNGGMRGNSAPLAVQYQGWLKLTSFSLILVLALASRETMTELKPTGCRGRHNLARSAELVGS